jgi:hypothetical protein
MAIISSWLCQMFPGAFASRRPSPNNKPRRRLAVEQRQERVTPSNLQAGGVVHLPFTPAAVEGTTGSPSPQVVTTNADVVAR